MPYIERGQDGKIKGFYNVKQTGYAEEFVTENKAELVTFKAKFEDMMKPKQDPALVDLKVRLKEAASTEDKLEALLDYVKLKEDIK